MALTASNPWKTRMHAHSRAAQQIQRTRGRRAQIFYDVRIDHGGFHAAMAQIVLNLPDVHALQQQVHGKTMAQRMRARGLARRALSTAAGKAAAPWPAAKSR